MFLGYSVLALPNLLLTAVQKIKKFFSQQKVEGEDLLRVFDNECRVQPSEKN